MDPPDHALQNAPGSDAYGCWLACVGLAFGIVASLSWLVARIAESVPVVLIGDALAIGLFGTAWIFAIMAVRRPSPARWGGIFVLAALCLLTWWAVAVAFLPAL